MFASLRDLIFTPACIGCGELGVHVCSLCLAKCSPLKSEDIAGLEQAVSASAYGGWLRDALIDYKNGSRRQVYGLAHVLQHAMSTCAARDPVTVVPMPSTREKIAARGFDTINLLVRECMKLQSHPVGLASQALYLRREVVDQVGLTAQQRELNVAHSMGARYEVNGNVLVVDDVITTGSTMQEAARVLRLAGAHKVFGISLCGSSKWE